jgi:hypothetical protein
MKHTLLPLCFIALLFSCKKDPVEGPAGPAGPQGPSGTSATGSFTGRIRQFNQYEEQYKTGLNTTTVSLQGTSNSAVTDVEGNYALNNVPQGTYRILLNRPGSREVVIEQIHMIGNSSINRNFELADTASFQFITCVVKDTMQYGEHAVKLVMKVPNDPKQRSVLALFSSSQNMNPANAETFDNFMTLNFSAGTSTSSYVTSIEWMKLPYTSGQKYYVRLYPFSGYNGTTEDLLTDRAEFNSTGTPYPTIFTLTMP